MILQTRALIFLLQKPGKFSHLVELLLLLLNRARVIVSPLSAFFSLVGSLGIEGVSGWCSGMAGAASGLGREILSPFLHPPSPLPGTVMPHRAGAARCPGEGRNQPLAGDGCGGDANPVPYSHRTHQDRFPRGMVGPLYLPEHPCPAAPAACSPSGQPLPPGARSQGWEAAGCRHRHGQNRQ